MTDASHTIGNLGGLNDAEAWRIEALRQKARAESLAADCAKGWAEARLLARTLDEVTGVPCSSERLHQVGPSCPRCGTHPDGTAS